MVELILGGAASGKSRFALERLRACAAPAVVVATGQAHDLGFREQIERHRQERSSALPVVESGLGLAATLRRLEGSAVLVDSLDFWAFAAQKAGVWPQEEAALLEAVAAWRQGCLLLVSQELGLCPVAADAATRRLVRSLGRLHQQLAAACQHVYLVVAGLPQTLK